MGTITRQAPARVSTPAAPYSERSATLTALGFTPLAPLYFLFLALAIVAYLALVKVVKRWLMRRRSA